MVALSVYVLKNCVQRLLTKKSRWRHIRLAIKPCYLVNHACQIKSIYIVETLASPVDHSTFSNVLYNFLYSTAGRTLGQLTNDWKSDLYTPLIFKNLSVHNIHITTSGWSDCWIYLLEVTWWGLPLGATASYPGHVQHVSPTLRVVICFVTPHQIMVLTLTRRISNLVFITLIFHTFYLNSTSKIPISMFIQTILILTFIAVARKWQSVIRPTTYTHDSRIPLTSSNVWLSTIAQCYDWAIFTLELNQSPNSH